MISANQRENDQSPTNDAAKDPAQQPEKSPAIKALTSAMFVEGETEGAVLMLQKHPEWRDEIIAFLQNKHGNNFVQMVLRQAPMAPTLSAEKKKELYDNVEWSDPSKHDKANANVAGKVAGGAAAASAMDKMNAGPTAESKPQETAATPAPAAESKPQMDAASQAPTPAPIANEPKKEDVAPAAQAAPSSAEPKPQAATEPTKEVAPPAKNEVAPAGQAPDAAAAPKNEDKSAAEKGKDEKPEEKADGGQVKITASALRIRAKASFNGQILGKIPRGKCAEVIGRDGVWLHVKFGDLTGYIHSKYTTSVKGNEQGEEEEQQDEASSHEPKQERPKNPTPVNDEQNQQGVLV